MVAVKFWQKPSLSSLDQRKLYNDLYQSGSFRLQIFPFHNIYIIPENSRDFKELEQEKR